MSLCCYSAATATVYKTVKTRLIGSTVNTVKKECNCLNNKDNMLTAQQVSGVTKKGTEQPRYRRGGVGENNDE